MPKFASQLSTSAVVTILVVAAAVALGAIYRTVAMDDLWRMAEANNRTLTQVLANSLGSQFRPLLSAATADNGAVLRASAYVDRLDASVREQTRDISVVKIKIYNLSGLTVYSTDRAQIGQDKSGSADFVKARNGEVASELEFRETFNAFGRILKERHLLASYIPVRGAESGHAVEAVFELYNDITPFVERANRTQIWIILGTTATFLSLYAALLYISRRADRTIRSQHRITMQLSGAIDATTAGVAISDPNEPGEPIVFVNPAFTRLTGYGEADAIGQNYRFLAGPDTDLAAVDELRGAVAAARPATVVMLVYRKDGSSFWSEIGVSPVFDDDGALSYFIWLQTDVSERRETEEQLRHAQKMEAIGKLTGGVAHEFNNLLTSIGGFARLIKRRVDDPEIVSEWIDEVITSSEQAAELTSQLLAFSRKQALDPELVQVSDVIGNMSGLLGPIIGVDITLKFDLADEDACAVVDPRQFLQVLVNLAMNAADAMPDGGDLTIGCRRVDIDRDAAARFPEARPGRYVATTVRDTGTGIDAETLAQVFEPFFTTKEVGKGTGLGLSMVYGMVQQSGGMVDVESEVGSGTTVTVYLPEGDKKAGGATEVETGAPAGANGETILIAEDEASVRRLAKITLKEMGYRVLTASDGNEALAIFREHGDEIDLVLSDMIMPGMGGAELARQLKDADADLKIIYMSGYTSTTSEELREQLGDDHVLIRKPFEPDELVRLVGDALRDRPRRAARGEMSRAVGS